MVKLMAFAFGAIMDVYQLASFGPVFTWQAFVATHARGIPFSGKREDAFPSGHALHMGALASAAGTLPPGPRRAIQALAAGLSLTRIVVLAHWASDVVAGFALGAVLERLLRLWTGYPLEASKEDNHADS